MSLVCVTNATVVCQNPSPLTADLAFSVSLDCLQDLTLPLKWRLIYVGSPADKSKDQELECVEIGPLKRGCLRFTLEAEAPSLELIDPQELWGSTVILLEASYRGQEFVRIGWYVHNVYTDPQLQDDPPDVPDISKMVRYIVADEPRVTRFHINWHDEYRNGCQVPACYTTFVPGTAEAEKQRMVMNDRTYQLDDGCCRTSKTVKLRISNPNPPISGSVEDAWLQSMFYDDKTDAAYTLVEVKVTRPWYGTSDQYGTAFGVLPLALGPLTVCIGFLIWGLYNILTPILAKDFTWDETGDVVIGVFKVLLSLIGLSGIVLKMKASLRILNVGYNVFMVSQSVVLVTKWLEWILAMAGVTTENNEPWTPSTHDIVYMVVYTVGIIAFLSFSLIFVIGWLRSTRVIMVVGGNGWERLNYIQILEKKLQQSFHPSDSTTPYSLTSPTVTRQKSIPPKPDIKWWLKNREFD